MVSPDDTMSSGSALSDPDSPPSNAQVFDLDAGAELRIEAAADECAFFRLSKGSAELFGTELCTGKAHSISDNVSVGIFTWFGARVHVWGSIHVVYATVETPMAEYVNVHAQLENSRNSDQSPRVMVVGAGECGKSSLCRILLSYAVRAGRQPVFVDLDVSHNDVAVPGTVAASSVMHPFDVTNGLKARVPVVFFYGHTSPAENVEHYSECIAELGRAIERRLDAHAEERTAGLIINTCGWVDGRGYDLLRRTIADLNVSHVIVLGQDRLHAQLQQELRNVVVVKVAKSGGVVNRTPSTKRKQAQARFRSYFYGPGLDLCPSLTMFKWHSIGIYQVGGQAQVPSTMLPIGGERQLEPNQIEPVTPSSDLTGSVLAVSQATCPEDILKAPVAGFVYVASVDIGKKSLQVLAPCPGPLPANCLLFGSLKWSEGGSYSVHGRK